jgi:glycosyltransferase involved in cell wall biosynthesis
MNFKPKSIIIFTRYNTQSASVRYRFIQYFNDMKINNINFELSYLFDDNFFKKKILLNKLNFIKIFYQYLKRLLKIIFIDKDKIVLIHLELFPYLPSFGEKILSLKKNLIILDLDDAIFHQYDKIKNPILSIFLKNKFNKIFKLPFLQIFSGNIYNIKEIKKINPEIKSYIFPTVVDVNYYKKKSQVRKNKDFTIVWIGSPSTSNYLKTIIKPLKVLCNNYDIKLRLIGCGYLELKDIQFESYMWNEKTEIQLISECHVGIMPLKNDDWSKGKCGFKLIQYMACSIPGVASPIGVNNEIIDNKINGFLANSDDEWINYIIKLKNDKKLYKKISEKAFEKVYNKYSFDHQRKEFISTLNNLK